MLLIFINTQQTTVCNLDNSFLITKNPIYVIHLNSSCPKVKYKLPTMDQSLSSCEYQSSKGSRQKVEGICIEDRGISWVA